MNQTQFKGFYAAAENRSFTKTAEQLFITAGRGDAAHSGLENAIGCILFDRRRVVQLTQAGRRFTASEKALEMESAVSRDKGCCCGGSGTLHIGFSRDMREAIFP